MMKFLWTNDSSERTTNWNTGDRGSTSFALHRELAKLFSYSTALWFPNNLAVFLCFCKLVFFILFLGDKNKRTKKIIWEVEFSKKRLLKQLCTPFKKAHYCCILQNNSQIFCKNVKKIKTNKTIKKMPQFWKKILIFFTFFKNVTSFSWTDNSWSLWAYIFFSNLISRKSIFCINIDQKHQKNNKIR